MPLGEATFGPEILMPWLANLLPEDANLLALGRNLGVSPQDVIGILERIGGDTAGALTIGGRSSPTSPMGRRMQRTRSRRGHDGPPAEPHPCLTP
jgi:serine/threonine-protein kinase HipA